MLSKEHRKLSRGWRQASYLGLSALAIVAMTSVASGQTTASQSDVILEDPGWPREYKEGGSTIVLHQPQVEEWKDYLSLTAQLAVSIHDASEAKAPVYGSVRLTSATRADFDSRTVYLYEVQDLDVSLPKQNSDEAEKVKALVREVVEGAPQPYSLDRILANLDQYGASTTTSGVNLTPPPIFYSEGNAILVIFDGEPIFAPVEKTTLMFAVNTNWDVFQERDGTTYFLRDEDRWYQTQNINSSWEPAKDLPSDLRKLPDNEAWSEIKKNVPGEKTSAEQMPRVFVSFLPAEMLLTEGPPAMDPIQGTGLLYLKNTTSDLFLHIEEQDYYLLLSGRWFKAPQLAGPWTAASSTLPADFLEIDPEHEMGHVLVSVPGTPEAEEAAIQANIPRQADVNRSDASLEVDYDGEPKFEPIETTEVQRAVNTSQDVLLVDNHYYACHDAVWFVGSSSRGPWIVCDTVPAVIYTIPASSPVHHVTYVRVYSHTSTTVVYGFTGGYMGLYVSNGCVVFGLGYYHHPYYYYPSHYAYPVYYPYRYHSYGCGAWYNHHTGTYSRGGRAYGPYGGIGRGATWNPHTGTYARSAGAWGPRGGTWGAEAWNPRTGTSARTRQSADPYKQWGSSVVSRGDNWVRTGHVSTRNGTLAGYETSWGRRGVAYSGDRGRSAVVGKSRRGDVYVGRDGKVYKHDNGWKKHEDGKWKAAEEPGKGADLRDRARTTDRAKTVDRSKVTQKRSDPAAKRIERTPPPNTSRKRRETVEQSRSRSTLDQLGRDKRARERGNQKSRKVSERSKRSSTSSRSTSRRSTPVRRGRR